MLSLRASVEPLGKIIASVSMITGLLVIALPITIIGSNYQEAHAEALMARAQLEEESLRKRELEKSALHEFVACIENHLDASQRAMAIVADLFEKEKKNDPNGAK
ncbi:MAG: hypothetical protein SGPRY_001347, partial [Prymnesium sp.]